MFNMQYAYIVPKTNGYQLFTLITQLSQLMYNTKRHRKQDG